MYYEINVSLYGSHYFATAERSLTFRSKALLMADKFRIVYPASEGWKVTLVKVSNTRSTIEITEDEDHG